MSKLNLNYRLWRTFFWDKVTQKTSQKDKDVSTQRYKDMMLTRNKK